MPNWPTLSKRKLEEKELLQNKTKMQNDCLDMELQSISFLFAEDSPVALEI